MNLDARKITSRVADQTAAVAALRAALSAEQRDDQETLDIVIESETDLLAALSAATDQITEDETLLLGIEAMLERIETRRERIKRRVAFVRAAIEQALDIAGKDKIELPGATLSLSGRGHVVTVTDEAEIAPSFWKRPAPVLDKAALNAAVKEVLAHNEIVAENKGPPESLLPLPAGVTISNKPRTLTIRRA